MQKGSISRYQIIEEIGRGGMGRVYKAYDQQLHRVVAMKMLICEVAAKSRDMERFLREARATAQLRHPNIVAVYDIGDNQGQPFFTMDFIEGYTLQVFREKKSPSIRQIVDIMIKVSNAIHYAHSHGIIHRDLKPANIIMDQNNEPKIMDFGLAKVERASKKLSKSGMILGTLQYMSPEQANGKNREIDKQSDVYSLGAILYEMLTDQSLFTGSTFNILYKIDKEEPIPPTKIKKRIHPNLESICLKALEKKKEKRYSDALSFAGDLYSFNQGISVKARPLKFWGRFYRKIKKYKVIIACFLVCILTLLIGVLLGKSMEQVTIQAKQTDKNLPVVKKDKKISITEKNLKKGEEYYQRGTKSHNQGDFKNAVKYCKKAIKFDPNHKDAYLYLGMIYCEKGNLERGIGYFNKAIEINPQFANSYLNRGIAYNLKGTLEKALKDLNKAIEINSRCTQAYYLRGQIYCQKQNLKEGIKNFNKTIQIDPKFARAYYCRGNIYKSKCNHHQAIKDYKIYLRLCPNDPQKNAIYGYINRQSTPTKK